MARDSTSGMAWFSDITCIKAQVGTGKKGFNYRDGGGLWLVVNTERLCCTNQGLRQSVE